MKRLQFILCILGVYLNSFGQNTFPSSGNVGIGTTSPSDILHVHSNAQRGSIRIGGGNGSGEGRVFIQSNMTDNNSYIDAYGDNTYKKLSIQASPLLLNNISNGNVGIGTDSPFARLHVKDGNHNGTIAFGSDMHPGLLHSSAITGEYRIDNRSSFIGYITFYPNGQNTTLGSEAMRITSAGNIAIGTSDPQGYKLAVAGDMIAESVKVKLQSAWPDYVFSKHYTLPDLQQVEQYIADKGHLSDIPSAKEVENGGINLGEMNAKLLKKIEELTLYIIEQNKQQKNLIEEVSALNRKSIN